MQAVLRMAPAYAADRLRHFHLGRNLRRRDFFQSPEGFFFVGGSWIYAVWFIFVNVFRPDPVGAIHILMLAYFAHLAVRALYLSINYRRSILVEPFDKL